MILFIFGCVEWGLLQLRCSASHCGGFSCCGARARGHVGSVVAAPRLQSTGVVLEAHGRTCSSACGIFPDQGSNLRHLHWQVDSLTLRHQESPPKNTLKHNYKKTIQLRTAAKRFEKPLRKRKYQMAKEHIKSARHRLAPGKYKVKPRDTSTHPLKWLNFLVLTVSSVGKDVK